MPSFKGRAIAFTWGDDGASPAVPFQIPGVREKGISLNGEPVDVSADDSIGWRQLLTVPAENQVDISLSGVTREDQLKTDWFADNRTKAVTITYPDGGVISGTFFLASYNETGAYNDATTFDAELQSTGAVAYTPAA
jgi:predicted secreted protein